MTKWQIKMLTTAKMQKLSFKWLLIIASKPKQFGEASNRAKQVLKEKYSVIVK